MIKDISYKKLQLAVLSGEVDFSKMNIFEEAKLEIPNAGIKIHAAIIGTSHFVQIKKENGIILTELLACDAIDDNLSKPLYFSPLADVDSSLSVASDFSYQFSYEFKSYKKSFEEISAWAMKAKLDSSLVFLEHQFEIELENPLTSRTILSIHAIEGGIRIKTVHEYREEDAIIVSGSLMKF